MDVDPNYDPSDFLRLPGAIKKERPDHDPNDEQPINDDDDDQIHQSYDDNQYDPTQMQLHQMKAEFQPYEMQSDNQTYNDDGAGHDMYQPQQQHIVLDDGEQQQHYTGYREDQLQQPQQQQQQLDYGQAVMMNVSDNLVYQNIDESGRVVQMQYQQANTDDGLGVGIDDDLAVSDSDDEEVLNAGDPPQQFDATTDEQPEQPAATFAKQEAPLEVEADDDDLWF